MAANTTPRYTLKGDNSSNNSTAMAPTFTTAAADYDGTGANNAVVFTADATNGSRIVGLRFVAKGSNTQSVARIYTNNGSTNGTASNNSLIGSFTLPSTTASNTSAETPFLYIFEGGYMDLEPGFRIVVGLATTVSAGWVVTPIQAGEF